MNPRMRWFGLLLCATLLNALPAQAEIVITTPTLWIGAQIEDAVILPDGRHVVTGGADLHVWNVETGAIERAWSAGESPVSCLALSADGSRVYSGHVNGKIRAWDYASGQAIRTYAGHAARVHCIAVSADATRLISGSADRTARTWNVVTGVGQRMFMPEAGEIASVAFSPNGAMALTGGEGKITLWNTADGQSIRTLEGHTDLVVAAVFSADSAQVLSCGAEHEVKAWRVSDGDELRDFKMPYLGLPASAQFSADGAMLLVGTMFSDARLWNVATGREMQGLGVDQHAVTGVAFTADGRRAVAASYFSFGVWDTATRQLVRSCGISENAATAYSSDGTLIATGGLDGVTKLWSASDGHEICALTGEPNRIARALAFSQDGSRLAAADRYAGRIWNIADGELLATLGENWGVPQAVAFSPDGRYLAVATQDNVLNVYDAQSTSGARVGGYTGAQTSSGYGCLDFSPDGSLLAIGSPGVTSSTGQYPHRVWDSEILLYGMAEGAVVRRIHTHWLAVMDLEFTPDGAQIIAAGRNGDNTPARLVARSEAALFDVASGENKMAFRGRGPFFYSAALSPDSRYVATGSFGGVTTVWSVASGRPGMVFKKGIERIEYLAFSPDGSRLLSGSVSGARLWDFGTPIRLHDLSGVEGWWRNE